MSCAACELKRKHPTSGWYRLGCPYCMARLIASARPLKRLQEGHIAACRHRLGADEWGRLWPLVQQLLRDNRLVEPADV